MAGQTDSPIPGPIDIDTPDGSIAGDVIAWRDEIWHDMEKYKSWLDDEWHRAVDLQQNGPTGKPWPKKPSEDFKKLDNGCKKVRSVLCGQDLHAYLISKCVESSEEITPESPKEGFKSLERMKAHLTFGWTKLQQMNKNTLAWHIQYGHWLIVAHAQHENEKHAGKRYGKWEEWLKQHIGISSSYGRKLRAVARQLGPYPGFRKLSLSFDELYKRRNQIDNMLHAHDQTCADYWRQA